MLGTSDETTYIPGSLFVNNITSVNKIEPYTTITSPSSTMTFDFKSGMIYYYDIDSLLSCSLSFTNIPITPQTKYTFTYIIVPTMNCAYYIIPIDNLITVNDNTTVPIFGVSNILLPSTFDYIIQTITLINTSTTTTPNFISLTDAIGY